jgi:uncharacterized protein with beta-barrel porin domain
MKQRKPSVDMSAVSGLRRERHFANGGTQTEWRGGVAWRIPNKKRQANREACRKVAKED